MRRRPPHARHSGAADEPGGVEACAPAQSRGWRGRVPRALGGCAHGGGSAGMATTSDKAPSPDSITVALWHLDEGSGAQLFDSGPFRLAAASGTDVRPDFGRVGGARRFQRTVDSFVYVPANPVLVPRAASAARCGSTLPTTASTS